MLCSTVEEENYYLLFPFESLLLLFLDLRRVPLLNIWDYWLDDISEEPNKFICTNLELKFVYVNTLMNSRNRRRFILWHLICNNRGDDYAIQNPA